MPGPLTTRLLRRAAGMAAAGAVVVAGGCGEAGGPGRAEYIAEADAICRSAQTQAAPIARELRSTAAAAVTGTVTLARMRRSAALVGELQAIGRSYLARLRDLERPSDDEEAIAAFLTPAGRVVDALADARAAFERGSAVGALAVLQRAEPVDAEAGAAARSYGFERCGSVISVFA